MPRQSEGCFGGARHLAQFYEKEDYLIQLVAEYVRQGIEAGETSILCMAGSRLKKIEKKLRDIGLDLSGAQGAKQMVMADAALTLEQLEADDGSMADRLRRRIEPMIE